MKYASVLAIALGIALLIFGLNYDTTVETGFNSTRVHNIGLIAERNNILLVSGIVLICGLILFGFSKFRTSTSNVRENLSMTRRCPHCAESIQAAAVLCRYCNSKVDPVSIQPTSDEGVPAPALLPDELGEIAKWGTYAVYAVAAASTALILRSIVGVQFGEIHIFVYAGILASAAMLGLATFLCQRKPRLALLLFIGCIVCFAMIPLGVPSFDNEGNLRRINIAFDLIFKASLFGVPLSVLCEYRRIMGAKDEQPQDL